MIAPSDRIAPELCKLTREPFDDPNTLFEPKLDGIRCIAYITNHQVTLINRAFNDITDRFPDVVPSLQNTNGDCILDGELVCLDKHGVPDFQRMQSRMNRKNLIAEYAEMYQATYVVFDCLSYEGRPLMKSSILARKVFLERALLSVGPTVRPITFTINDGIHTFEKLTSVGWEGIVAKPIDSHYRPGQRKEWLKIKATHMIDAVVLACTLGAGRRQNKFGALVLAERMPGTDDLSYLGEVGTGFTDEDLDTLLTILHRLKTDNGTDGNIKFYVEPKLTVRIKYLEKTDEGLLRFPVYIGVLGY